jgi:predicted nucleic acid-binding protein
MDTLFLDTDCLSAFLWVDEENLLYALYPGRLVIPGQVRAELSYVPKLKSKTDALIACGKAAVEDIETGTEAAELYYILTESPSRGHVPIGRGEAACIALAKVTDGILASNNLRDVSAYVHEFKLRLLTTGDILVDAYRGQEIDEERGNIIWAKMLAKRRQLGAETFSEFLQHQK